MSAKRSGTASVPVRKVAGPDDSAGEDMVAVEEPLAIRLSWGESGQQVVHDIAVTMRTPVNDFELALGFLFTEGIIRAADEIASVSWDAAGEAKPTTETSNTVRVHLHAAPATDPQQLQRNFYVSSSCGVCGKASIDAIRTHSAWPVRGEQLQISAEVLHALPAQLAEQQRIFAGTGSIHAAAAFTAQGLSGEVYEDVGRHNAVDKLVGAALQAGRLPLWDAGVIVSGRASFELVQKARMAGAAMLVAVGAPSSLAVELAWESDMSLIGFLRDGRFNIYTGPDRVSS